MKKIFLLLSMFAIFTATCFAQVSAADVEKAYKILEASDDVLAYHGD